MYQRPVEDLMGIETSQEGFKTIADLVMTQGSKRGACHRSEMTGRDIIFKNLPGREGLI